MRAGGLLQTRLTRNHVYDAQPAFSADGKKIAFSSTRITNSLEIFVMNADGTGDGATNRTNHPAVDIDPSWQPLP